MLIILNFINNKAADSPLVLRGYGMNIYYSNLCLLGGQLEDTLQQLPEQGSSHLELMMDGVAWDSFEQRQEELLSVIRSFPVTCSLHTPCWDVNMAAENRHVRDAGLQSALDALEFAARLGCTHLVVHPGFCQTPVFDRSKAQHHARQALEILCRRAGETGVRLAVENVGYGGTCLYNYPEFSSLLDRLGSEVGYLLDVGHAVLNGWDPVAATRHLAPRLLALHLHDNDGVTDSHLPIGQGTIPWDALWEEVARLPHSVNLILEYNFGTPLERLAKDKHMLEARLGLAGAKA